MRIQSSSMPSLARSLGNTFESPDQVAKWTYHYLHSRVESRRSLPLLVGRFLVLVDSPTFLPFEGDAVLTSLSRQRMWSSSQSAKIHLALARLRRIYEAPSTGLRTKQSVFQYHW